MFEKRIVSFDKEDNRTYFDEIYYLFLNNGTIHDYISRNVNEVIRSLQGVFLGSLNGFIYPKFPIYNFVREDPKITEETEVGEDGAEHIVQKIEDRSYFPFKLTFEEKDIISRLMIVQWLGQQLFNDDLTGMIFTGSDFSATSQANHMSRLNAIKKQAQTDVDNKMFAYDASTIDNDGYRHSDWGDLCFDGNVGKHKLDFNKFRR